MKNALLLMVLITGSGMLFSQTKTFDLTELKSKTAEVNGVNQEAISSLKVVQIGDRNFVYAKLTKDSRPVTYTQEFALGGPGGIIPIKGSITCTGYGCAECDIENFHNPEQAYCNCVRKTLENGRCDMTKSYGF
jgi:hypothetical protein